MPTYNKEDRRLVFSSEESYVNRCPVCGAEPYYEPYRFDDNTVIYPWLCPKCGSTGGECSDAVFKAQYVDVDSLPPDIRGEYVELKTNCINGPLGVGDLVLSTIDRGGFPCLPGRVMKIHLLGSAKHDTGNESDDIFVDFRGDYSEQRKREIMSAHRNANFKKIRLDEIIMAPDCLININDINERALEAVKAKEEHAIRYAYHVVSERLAEYEKSA